MTCVSPFGLSSMGNTQKIHKTLNRPILSAAHPIDFQQFLEKAHGHFSQPLLIILDLAPAQSWRNDMKI